MSEEKNTKTTCPECKESIKEDAIKCRHCHIRLTPKVPAHEGICTYCKEVINKEATRCYHCKSNLPGCKDCGDDNGGGLTFTPPSISDPNNVIMDDNVPASMLRVNNRRIAPREPYYECYRAWLCRGNYCIPVWVCSGPFINTLSNTIL